MALCDHRSHYFLGLTAGRCLPLPRAPGRDDDVSIGLYRLGRAIGRHRGMVVGIWVLVLVALGGAAATFGDRY